MKARVANESLADLMDQHTVVGAAALCKAEGDRIRCLACGHACLIGEGLRGICKARFNDAGKLKVPHGYVAGLQCDPVEKKPFFHVYPGSDALTFGMLGCDLHCSYCQNWLTSQALRDKDAVTPLRPISAAQLCDVAFRERARLVVSSYNEPLITAEWAVDVFREAKAAGLDCAFVSNGNATPEVLDFLRPWIIAYKVDLKSFNDRSYRSLGGTLANITRTIGMIHDRGIWLEVVTLVIPGFNDSDQELQQAARFLASISPNIPWHVTAFHKDYNMTDPDSTSAETLVRAAEIGASEGLRFVYAGNLPGQVGPWENTRCPSCGIDLIERFGFLVRSYRITSDGRCPHCQTLVPGVWPSAAGEVRTGNDSAAYQKRRPRPVSAIGEIERSGDRVLGEQKTRKENLIALPTTKHAELTLSKERTTALALAEPKASTGSLKPGRLDFTAEQKEQLLVATAAMLHAAVAGQPALFPEHLTELRGNLVAGAFVTLKRGRHLRSCCGLLGQLIPLGQALERAAIRTIWEDSRFPPISPTELEHLTMEVWLLFQLELVQARGEQRLQSIVIGKHGVQVARTNAHALFLPSVAVEHEWDARRFLSQVCTKAGLPTTAWQDDATTLSIFEGEVCRCRLAGSERTNRPRRRLGPCRQEDLAAYVEFCRGNLRALLTGATPSSYLWGAPDGLVNGVVLFVGRPGERETVPITQLSMRPGFPLQATLFALLGAAARQLASRRMTLETLENFSVNLALLHDPVLHGTVADPHFDGFDPEQRAILVTEHRKSVLLFDPARTVEELLAEAAVEAKVTNPATAAVFSMEVVSSITPFRCNTVPRPVRGPAVRKAAVAGTFYEAEPGELKSTVDRLLAGEARQEHWPAALVPHAGIRFSGHIAAGVLKSIQVPKTVIVIGPKHTPRGVEWAVAPHQTWEMPGFTVESDFLLARRLCQAVPGLEMDAAAHEREHAIEVELPFLAGIAPMTKVVGIVIGHGDRQSCRRFAEGLACLLNQRDDRPLLLISSDMNHFATDTENRRLDELAIAAMERGDPDLLYETVTRHSISMCGVLPAVIVLETLRLLDWRVKGKRVGYATSADTTGDTSRVVGYAGMLFG